MWRSKPFTQKNKGFTLIELLMWICLFSILFLAYFSVLEYTNNVLKMGDGVDQVLSNARFGIEYIKEEILSADRIIPIDKFQGLEHKYPLIFDFVILTIYETRNDKNIVTKTTYNYATYYLQDDELRRIAVNAENQSLPIGSEFSGHNQISTNVSSIDDTKLLRRDKIIRLCLGMGENNKKNFETKVYINCPID